MKKFIALAIGLLATVAIAGSVSSQTVNVWTDSSGLLSANGSLAAARYTADSTQYIGCSLFAYSTGSYSATCYATNATGTYASCFTIDPQMLGLVRTLNSASYLYFVVNADGTCNRVITVNSSFNLR